MLVREVALVAETDDVSPSQIMRVAAALQKQVARDFAPFWGISATVDGLATLDDLPLGYWPVVIVQDVEGAAGVHLDRDGQPFALVEAGPSWSLTASHETLEMLADPFGNRLIAGDSPVDAQGRVQFLVEVCDPPEDAEFAYTVNSVLVSDFYTPQYFDPVKRAGVPYDFTGAIAEPRQVLPGGYLSWHDPVTDRWFQHTFFDGVEEFPDLGTLTRGRASLREAIDARTPQTQRLSRLPADTGKLTAAVDAATRSRSSSLSRARRLRNEIESLKSAASSGSGGRADRR
jgi:hypothetical protein